MTKPKFRVVVIAPDNYPHSAAFSELSETLVYALKSLGHEASAAINDFSIDAINIILGAHLISEAMAQRIPAGSIIYNTEQFDADSAWMGTRLLDLIRKFETWDYSRRNVAFLSGQKLAPTLHLVPIGFVPQLARIQQASKQDIDVLFYGSMNERRAHILDALRARGLMVVTAFNCYGYERDALIARAKVILNVHYYESKIFEIVRVSYLLTNHKAVVSEVGAETDMDPIFRDAVAGVPYDRLVETCAALVADDLRRSRLEQRGFEIMSSVREEVCLRPVIEARFMDQNSTMTSSGAQLPRKINLGSGKNYSPGYLNIDINDYWKPDLVVDLSSPGVLNGSFHSAKFGNLQLLPGYFDRIEAIDVLEHVSALTTLMTHCLELLSNGGEFAIKVPYDFSYGAWQDPTHVRAFNERSWLYYTDWFWYLGWRESRFDMASNVVELSPLGKKLQAEGMPIDAILLQPRAVDGMHVTLRKRPLSAEERLEVENYHRRPER